MDLVLFFGSLIAEAELCVGRDDCYLAKVLQDFGPVVLPVAQNGYREPCPLEVLAVALLAHEVDIRLIPAGSRGMTTAGRMEPQLRLRSK